jgi:RHS repeat-associated protein
LFKYTYDGAGQRVLKSAGNGQRVSVNGKPAGQTAGIGNYTIYVNPYMDVRSGGFTKHFYTEEGKIVSKLGESGRSTGGNGNGGGNGNNLEAFQFYYHSDHLGNTAYITDRLGEVYQHLEYFPFGETFVEEKSNTWRTPYLYNGKELDDETGLYYYGARYYDARTSTWPSVDELWEQPDDVDISPYAYVRANPISYNDPDGRAPGKHPKVVGKKVKKSAAKYSILPAPKTVKIKYPYKGTIGMAGTHSYTQKHYSLKKMVEADHVPAFKAMEDGGITLSRGQMPAVTIPYKFHRELRSTGSGLSSQKLRKDQSTLIKKGRMADAIDMSLTDYEETAKFLKKQKGSAHFAMSSAEIFKVKTGLNDLIDEHESRSHITNKQATTLKKRVNILTL